MHNAYNIYPRRGKSAKSSIKLICAIFMSTKSTIQLHIWMNVCNWMRMITAVVHARRSKNRSYGRNIRNSMYDSNLTTTTKTHKCSSLNTSLFRTRTIIHSIVFAQSLLRIIMFNKWIILLTSRHTQQSSKFITYPAGSHLYSTSSRISVVPHDMRPGIITMKKKKTHTQLYQEHMDIWIIMNFILSVRFEAIRCAQVITTRIRR